VVGGGDTAGIATSGVGAAAGGGITDMIAMVGVGIVIEMIGAGITIEMIGVKRRIP